MIGRTIAHYTINAKIGEGGMGEVYRAVDTKLKRDVALKVLPESLTRDPERVARFRREAEVLASLNHPNIGAIHGLEESDDSLVLVLELIEGEDLKERIAKGPVPLQEALKIALQVVEALEAAHEKGIIHRDLKPANIKVTPEGHVKVLDFGLAKVFGEESNRNMADSPTLTAAATQAGVILGTAAYMSPEQARGRPVDRRSDIWAFGVVLWEMLAGSAPFGGATVSDILASILKDSPSRDDLTTRLPPALNRLLDRCLERDQRQRLQWIGDARLELMEALNQAAEGRNEAPQPAAVRSSRWQLLPWGLAALFLIAWAAAWFTSSNPVVPKVASYTWQVAAPEGTSFVVNQGAPALSPDGRQLVFLARNREGVRQLWLRRLDELESRVLPGTELATSPFWSPDGLSIAFFSENELRKIDSTGGQPQKIASIPVPVLGGSTWRADGTILSANRDGTGILRIDPGGSVSQLTFDENGREWYGNPWFLPDGNQFLLTVTDIGGGREGIFVAELDGGKFTRLLPNVSSAWFAGGKLIYWQQGTLRAVSFDPMTLEISGTHFRLADDVAYASLSLQAFSAVSEDALVYLPGSPLGPGELVWLDRGGVELRVLGDNADYYRPRLSPDGSELAVDITSPFIGSGDIWRFDTARGAPLRLTSDVGNESYPVWSPDGRELIYFRGSAIYRKLASGTGPEKLVLADETARLWPADWSRDGRLLIYHRGQGPASGSDLWVLDLASGQSSPWIVSAEFIDEDATFSPDGKSIAYASNQSGEFEIYLQDFPDQETRLPISQGGGTGPRWSEDGSELFYYSPGKGIMAVPISRTPELRAGIPELLFKIELRSIGGEAFFDVTRNGQRFLVTRFAEQTSPGPLIVRSGWVNKVSE